MQPKGSRQREPGTAGVGLAPSATLKKPTLLELHAEQERCVAADKVKREEAAEAMRLDRPGEEHFTEAGGCELGGGNIWEEEGRPAHECIQDIVGNEQDCSGVSHSAA